MGRLLRGLSFYLAPALPDEEKAELKRLIKENGGVLSESPEGATQIVPYDLLDARHLDRLSAGFIKDSVAYRVLQDPKRYSGAIFTVNLNARRKRRGSKTPYTLEDDARMLHFARLNCRDTGFVPMSAWERAASERVTLHSAQSMNEHFRKQLRIKTLDGKRITMATAAATTRARLLEQEAEAEEEEDEEGVEVVDLSPIANRSTGFLTPEASARTGPTGSLTSEPSMEFRLKEVGEEKVGRRRTRSRKPTSPLQISQRIHNANGSAMASPPPAAPTHLSSAAATPKTVDRPSRTPGGQSTERKRRRVNDIEKSSSSFQEAVGSEAKSEEGKATGIFFISAWTESCRSERRLLQRFFGSASVPTESSNASTAHEEDNEPLQNGAPQATEQETEAIICQLQLETHQDLQLVAHALYACSGDVETARSFLKGALPSDFWCPEDDLLLVSLVADERASTIRSSVQSAVARGDFASMQMARDTDAILKRVAFLS